MGEIEPCFCDPCVNVRVRRDAVTLLQENEELKRRLEQSMNNDHKLIVSLREENNSLRAERDMLRDPSSRVRALESDLQTLRALYENLRERISKTRKAINGDI